MKLLSQQGKKLGIFGLARTGEAAYKALENCAQSIIVYDDSDVARQKFIDKFPKVQAYMIDLDNKAWLELDKILLSPNIPLTYPKAHKVVELARDAGITITSDLELLHEETKTCDIIGITGTNGKSTTTSLIYHILITSGLDYQCGGNIGIACLELPLSKGYVIELSSYQLDLLQNFHLNTAIILNITPDHIDRHGTFENYIQSKRRICDYLTNDGTLIISIDCLNTRHIYDRLCNQDINFNIIPISVEENIQGAIYGEFYENKILIFDNINNTTLSIDANIYLQGKHNLENLLAAYAATSKVGKEKFEYAIGNFVGLEHRMEFVTSSGNISFYNDSKATNADAASRSLSSLDNIYWIAGGVQKEGGISSLRHLMPRVKKAYFYGQSATKFATSVEDICAVMIFDTIEEALWHAYEDAKSGSIDANSKSNILLAPAAASFDQFKDYAQRGTYFKELVHKLILQKTGG